jgi:DNA-binding GntR family transcriptional regulator
MRNFAGPTLQPIEKETLWDRVYAQLRDALFAGRFEPGERLVLRELADSLGTSITPVRDAVARLIANGVLTLGPRNTALVPDVGTEVFKQLLIVRTELEGRAACEAARNVDAKSVSKLERRLAQMQKLIVDRNLKNYLDLHRQFHFGIYEMAKMPVLYEMIESLWLRCGPALSFVLPEYVYQLKGTDHHLKVLDAIRKGDTNRAEAEIIADIEEAGQYLLSLADEKGRIRRPGG